MGASASCETKGCRKKGCVAEDNLLEYRPQAGDDTEDEREDADDMTRAEITNMKARMKELQRVNDDTRKDANRARFERVEKLGEQRRLIQKVQELERRNSQLQHGHEGLKEAVEQAHAESKNRPCEKQKELKGHCPPCRSAMKTAPAGEHGFGLSQVTAVKDDASKGGAEPTSPCQTSTVDPVGMREADISRGSVKDKIMLFEVVSPCPQQQAFESVDSPQGKGAALDNVPIIAERKAAASFVPITSQLIERSLCDDSATEVSAGNAVNPGIELEYEMLQDASIMQIGNGNIYADAVSQIAEARVQGTDMCGYVAEKVHGQIVGSAMPEEVSSLQAPPKQRHEEVGDVVAVSLHYLGKRKYVRHLSCTVVGNIIPETLKGERRPLVIVDSKGFEVASDVPLSALARQVPSDGLLELTCEFDDWDCVD